MVSALSKCWTDFRSEPLSTIREWQNSRLTWLIMLGTAVFLESTALYFQYVLQMDPCEQCVYQRLAVMLLGIAALVMLIAPRNKAVRGVGYFIWIVAAVYGMNSALTLMGYYNPTNLFMTCKALPTFPFDLPLYDWLPQLFLPSGFCGEDDWLFLGLNMAHWLIFTFGLYILACVLCVLSLFTKKA